MLMLDKEIGSSQKEVTSEARQRYLYLIRQNKDDKEQSTSSKKDQSRDLKKNPKGSAGGDSDKDIKFSKQTKSLFKIVLINIMKKLRKRDWQLGGE